MMEFLRHAGHDRFVVSLMAGVVLVVISHRDEHRTTKRVRQIVNHKR